MIPRIRAIIQLASLLLISACAAPADLEAERLDDAWSIDTGAIRCVIDDRNYVRSLTLPDGRELMAEGGGSSMTFRTTTGPTTSWSSPASR